MLESIIFGTAAERPCTSEVRRSLVRRAWSAAPRRFRILLSISLIFPTVLLQAQLTPAEKQSSVGDAPAVGLPLARDVSGQLKRRKVAYALHKVADWQLARAEGSFNQDWTFAALYAGFMAVPDQAGGQRYREAERGFQLRQRRRAHAGSRVGHDNPVRGTQLT